jgi:hypothetical protein
LKHKYVILLSDQLRLDLGIEVTDRVVF